MDGFEQPAEPVAGLGNAPLGDGVNWQMSYRLTDVYGGQYWTPAVKNY